MKLLSSFWLQFFFKHHGAAFELINLEITATPVVLYLPIAAEMVKFHVNQLKEDGRKFKFNFH